MRRSDPSLRWWFAAVALALVLAADDDVPAQQIVPGTNVNMVSGTTLPDGDPYLQRQNEPSSAVSTSNPLHILAGVNDYRTVDIPHPSDLLRPQRMNSDAWVGLFKSLDGGQNWKSTLLPGYPQDPARTAPLWGYDAATDPFMRAGTNGMFYFAGLAFDRGDNAPSAIFVARYMDMNNLEAGDPIVHLDTRIADSDPGGRFLDKVALATDIPRTAATCSFNVPLGDAAGTVVPQTIPAGNVYVAYAAFTGSGATEQSAIMFSRSTDCGATWSAPRNLSTGSRLVQNAQIAVSPNNGHDLRVVAALQVGHAGRRDVRRALDRRRRDVREAGARGRPPARSTSRPTLTSFRTNGFQTMAVDAHGPGLHGLDRPRIRHAAARPAGRRRARRDLDVHQRHDVDGAACRSTPAALGHQVMPALTFHAGKLRLLYYDLREDVSSIFAPFVDDLDIVHGELPGPAHAGCVRRAGAARADAGLHDGPPVGLRVRLHAGRGRSAAAAVQSAEPAAVPPGHDAVHGRLHRPGAGAGLRAEPGRQLVAQHRRVECGEPRVLDRQPRRAAARRRRLGELHAAVGDRGRPAEPLRPDSDRSRVARPARPACGIRTSTRRASPKACSFRRRATTSRSTTSSARSWWSPKTPRRSIRTFRLTIENQPVGGQASFLQFSPLPTLDVTIPPFSSMARTVFASSTDENARINVSIIEITAPGGVPVAGGLSGNVVLNPDPQAPRLQNPRLQNPRLQNPLISEGEAYNAGITNAVFAVPRLQNPRLQNPTIENPRLQNDSLGNPRLQNDAVANPGVVSVNPTNTTVEAPRLQNPRLQNPRLQNESLVNAAFADTQLVPDQRRQHDGRLHRESGAERTDSRRVRQSAADPQDDDDAGRERLQPCGAAADRPRRQYSRIPSSCRFRTWPIRGCRIRGCRTRRWPWRLASRRRSRCASSISTASTEPPTMRPGPSRPLPSPSPSTPRTSPPVRRRHRSPIPLTIATTSLAPAAPGAPLTRARCRR